MIRNNLRVLEQKVNSHEKLSDGDKVEMQQYILALLAGRLTTFNILFQKPRGPVHLEVRKKRGTIFRPIENQITDAWQRGLFV